MSSQDLLSGRFLSRHETEAALVTQAAAELGSGHSLEEAHAAVEKLAGQQAEKELEQRLKDSEKGNQEQAASGSSRGIHVMLTSNGSPYMNWQTRVMYHSYLKVASAPGSDMKYFTRVLHRSKEDALMDDLPTVRDALVGAAMGCARI